MFDAYAEMVKESHIDFAESKMFELIEGVSVLDRRYKDDHVYNIPPDAGMIRFYLQTQGKDRGYIITNDINMASREEIIEEIRRQYEDEAERMIDNERTEFEDVDDPIDPEDLR